MPSTLTFPGVYVEEIPSGVRTIIGVATSITAFIGRALRGPVNNPVVINSNADFQRIFGGLWLESSLGYSVRDFFLNGGSQAIVVRVYNPDDTAGKAALDAGEIKLEAVDEGSWGRNLRARVDVDVSDEVAKQLGLKKADLFNLTVSEVDDQETAIRTESFLNVSLEESARRIDRVLKDDSQLVRWRGDFPSKVPAVTKGSDPVSAESDKVSAASDKLSNAKRTLIEKENTDPPVEADINTAKDNVKKAGEDLQAALDARTKKKNDIQGGSDGAGLVKETFIGDDKKDPLFADKKEGLFALEKADLFNLLCLPPYNPLNNVDGELIDAAAQYCETKRAMLIVDPLAGWRSVEAVKNGLTDIQTTSKNAALFFPRLRQPNPLRENKLEDFVPCGAVAGIFARTDTERGVWKAPAGLDATLVGVPQLTVPLTNDENGELNPLGINCLRTMPAAGRVVWGSRTLKGNDRLASEWKYIPVRRTALFIEESLYRALQCERLQIAPGHVAKKITRKTNA